MTTTLFVRHSEAPWTNNGGTVETPQGEIVLFLESVDNYRFLPAAEFAAKERECAANADLVLAAPAMLSDLRYALSCFLSGRAPHSDRLAGIVRTLAAASGQDVVTFGQTLSAAKGGAL